MKYLLEQRITTQVQHKWLLKLLEYNYTLKYCPGSSNTVLDALSRQHELLAIMGLSQPIFYSIFDIQVEYFTDPPTQTIIEDLQSHGFAYPNY